MEIVTLTFQYTQNEYIKAERQYLLASKTITKTSAIISAAYLFLTLFYSLASSFSVLSIVALGIALFVLIVGCTIYYYVPAYKFKRISKYHEEYHLSFSNDSIKFKTETINSELKWDIYTELWESNDFYFLIQSPQMYTLIPKRAFLNLTAKQTFEEIALSNLKGAKRILKA